jgi:phosphoserine phosphatase
VVAEGLATVIDPITYAEARVLIDEHRAAGRSVYIVSAAPAEIVEPLARHLGVDGAIASQAEVDDSGRYTGHMERYAYGPAKAELMRQVADRDGIDLLASWAYSDSVTDLPMLEAVGHPVAVNPDRALRRIARVRGWDVRRFEHLATPSTDAAAEDVSSLVVGRGSPLPWWPPALAAAVAATTGGLTVMAWRRRSQPRPA